MEINFNPDPWKQGSYIFSLKNADVISMEME